VYVELLTLQKFSGCDVQLAVCDGVCSLVHLAVDLGHVSEVMAINLIHSKFQQNFNHNTTYYQNK
jgi:hypothetical protein